MCSRLSLRCFCTAPPDKDHLMEPALERSDTYPSFGAGCQKPKTHFFEPTVYISTRSLSWLPATHHRNFFAGKPPAPLHLRRRAPCRAFARTPVSEGGIIIDRHTQKNMFRCYKRATGYSPHSPLCTIFFRSPLLYRVRYYAEHLINRNRAHVLHEMATPTSSTSCYSLQCTSRNTRWRIKKPRRILNKTDIGSSVASAYIGQQNEKAMDTTRSPF